MRIIYDDLTEFTRIRLNCETTRNRKMCHWCPFTGECLEHDDENIHTMCCTFADNKEETK